MSWNTEYLRIDLDSIPQGSYTYEAKGAWVMCSGDDNLLFFNKNLTTHTANTFTVDIKADLGPDVNKGILMRNFFLYVDTCDISCATCDGPTDVRYLFLLVTIKLNSYYISIF